MLNKSYKMTIKILPHIKDLVLSEKSFKNKIFDLLHKILKENVEVVFNKIEITTKHKFYLSISLGLGSILKL